MLRYPVKFKIKLKLIITIILVLIALKPALNFGSNFNAFLNKTLARASEGAIRIYNLDDGKEYFVKDGIKHRIDSYYALEALGRIGLKFYEGEWRIKIAQSPEGESIILDEKICSLAENRENCITAIKNYQKALLPPTFNKPELIVFDFKATCDDTPTSVYKTCSFSRLLEKNKVQDCQRQSNSKECVEKLIIEACEPLDNLGERYKYTDYRKECYGFFAEELDNVSLCELAFPQTDYCYQSLATKTKDETKDERICELIEEPQIGPDGGYYGFNYKGYCYSKLAQQKRNTNLCGKADIFLGDCYQKLAVLKTDIFLCDNARGYGISCHKQFSQFGWDALTQFNLQRVIWIIISLISAFLLIYYSVNKWSATDREENNGKRYLYASLIIGSIYIILNALFIALLVEDRQLLFGFFSPNTPFVLVNFILFIPFFTKTGLVVDRSMGRYGYAVWNESLVFYAILFTLDFLFIVFIGYLFSRINSAQIPILRRLGNIFLSLLILFLLIANFAFLFMAHFTN